MTASTPRVGSRVRITEVVDGRTRTSEPMTVAEVFCIPDARGCATSSDCGACGVFLRSPGLSTVVAQRHLVPE